MKATVLFIITTLSLLSCNLFTAKETAVTEPFVAKAKFSKNDTIADTLWVSHNDTTVFKKVEYLAGQHHQKREIKIRYELKNPVDKAYYFIYNVNNQLIGEGIYNKTIVYEGKTYNEGNFYNFKSYYYKNNGNLKSIHYMVDGRNSKVELYDRKKRLTEIIYFDKKSSDKTKVEIYSKGKLKETRVYKSFDTYTTYKPNEKTPI